MKQLFLLLLSLFIISCQPATEDEAPREVTTYSIEQFMNNTSVFGGSFSPDESKLLISSDETGIFNAYLIPFEGGEKEALTNSTGSSIFAVSHFPEDGRVLFRSDDNGNEIYHLFVREEDGEVKELTPGAEARATFYGWSDDLKSFYYGFNQRNPQLEDIYKMDIATYESTMIYQNDQALAFNGISDDEKFIAFIKPVNTNDADLLLYNRDTEEMEKINETQSANSVADFGPDGEALYYLTDVDSEFGYLMKYDFQDGSREKVDEADWDIWYSYFSYNGKYRITGINEDGKTVVEVIEVSTGKDVDFPEFETGSITSVRISRSEEKVAFYVGSSNSPSDLYTYDFDSKKLNRLTENLNDEINADDLVEATVVRFPSFDELEIPAIYYKPHTASSDNKVPALVWVHGGPGGQSRQSYFGLIQYLVNHGYAILAVNNRGSSGYGKTFYAMDNKRHGEEDLMDCVYGKKYLETLDYIDPDKIGIIGGSYGGFMVMAALTRHPEEFDVGVNLFGVTNWLRTLKSIPPWWESFKDALYDEMGDPATDSVRLYNISPVFHGDKVVRPVMVLQGSKDPRVLQVESDEMVAAVRANGVPVEYVLFEDEGHGFVKKENQIEGYGKILVFLNEYLKKELPG